MTSIVTKKYVPEQIDRWALFIEYRKYNVHVEFLNIHRQENAGE
jgi:hypothetical protein